VGNAGDVRGNFSGNVDGVTGVNAVRVNNFSGDDDGITGGAGDGVGVNTVSGDVVGNTGGAASGEGVISGNVDCNTEGDDANTYIIHDFGNGDGDGVGGGDGGGNVDGGGPYSAYDTGRQWGTSDLPVGVVARLFRGGGHRGMLSCSHTWRVSSPRTFAAVVTAAAPPAAFRTEAGLLLGGRS